MRTSKGQDRTGQLYVVVSSVVTSARLFNQVDDSHLKKALKM